MSRTTKRAREHSANYAARQRGRRTHRTAAYNLSALCSGAEQVRVLRPAQDEAGLEDTGARAEKAARAVPGIMSRYAQRSAAGTARALSAHRRITDTMPGPVRAAGGPRWEIPQARNPRQCRIAAERLMWPVVAQSAPDRT